jgi:predicted DCC family thiol-disulfide oxidoreductase YuxK
MLDRMDLSPDQETRLHDVWLVYDGQCPYSRLASRIIRIQTNLGRLVLLDARQSHNHPMVRDLGRLGLDLNRGMVVRFHNRFYHAHEALHKLAQLEAESDAFNWLHARLLRSRTLACLTAIGASAVRSSWLWVSGKPGISLPGSA